MYQVAVCICNFMVFSITMSGWPSWVTQMTESPPCHDRVPLLQVSPCVTPHVANQNMTSNEADIDIKDITGFHEKCTLCILFVTIVFKFLNHHLHVQLLLNYSSFLDIALYQPITSYKIEKKTFSLCWGLQKKTFSSKKTPFIRFLTISIYMQKLAVVLEARKFNDDFSLC
jgi:hypothetical protein